MSDYAYIEEPKITPRKALLLYAALMFPAYLNDFTFIVLAGSQWIYAADYGWRVLTLIAAAALAREIAFTKGRRRSSVRTAWVATITALFASLAMTRHVEIPVDHMFEGYDLFHYPPIEFAALYWFDLTAACFWSRSAKRSYAAASPFAPFPQPG